MQSNREKRLQVLESGLAERVDRIADPFREHIYKHLTISELEALTEPYSAEHEPVYKRFRELRAAAEAENLPVAALNVGIWALEMLKAVKI